MNKICKKELNLHKRNYKRLSKAVRLRKPPMQTKVGTAKELYYGVYNSQPIVAKCYDHDAIEFGKSINDMFLALVGRTAMVIANNHHRYYISPYSDSGTVKELIDGGVRFNEKDIIVFFQQMAQELTRLHEEAKLYHGELTPDHIIINRESKTTVTFKICGFGHYVKKPRAFYEDPTRKPYLDPRVIEDPNKEYDSACDVWSLGVIAYKLTTGNFPDIEDKSDIGEFYERLNHYPDSPITSLLNWVISRCLFSLPFFRILAKNIQFHPFFTPICNEIKDYTIGANLGTGASGSVNKAILKSNPSRVYAAKIMNPNKTVKSFFLAVGEVYTLQILRDSPYIVKLLDHFNYDNEFYLILKLYNGGDLSQYLIARNRQLLKEKEEKKAKWSRIALEMIEDIKIAVYNLTRALHCLHSKEIIHRDIKPHNLLLKLNKVTKRLATAKLSDFGASRELIPDKLASTIVATEGYAAPEIFFNSYDKKIDVWSLGATLYYIAYGMPPRNYQQGLYSEKFVKYPEKPLYQLPNSFFDLLKRCLVFDPKKRASMEEIISHPYFHENPCVTLSGIPDYYEVDEKPIVKGHNLLVRKVVYLPTNTTLLLKQIAKDESIDKKIVQAINDLISFREYKHIYCLHHCFTIDDNYYFVLDYTSGETLEDQIKEKGGKRLSSRKIKATALRLAKTISNIHMHDLTHGAIEASNIYFCEESKAMKLAGYNSFIQNVTGKESASGKTNDIYAFGKVLYHMIFATTDSYSNCLNSSEEDKLKAENNISAFKLIEKCATGVYQSISEVLNDSYFKS